MALKQKGQRNISGRKASVPKAGPKKRRAKNEAERIREAVEEHGKRGIKPARRAGKVNSFQYKESEAPAKVEEPDTWKPYLRMPHEFVAFKDALPEDLQPMAAKLFTMQCDHMEREITAVIAPLDPSKREEWWRCERCWYSAKKQSKTTNLMAEWNSYCPEGMDMFDWEDMFTRDKGMWRFIYEEAEYDLVAEVLA